MKDKLLLHRLLISDSPIVSGGLITSCGSLYLMVPWLPLVRRGRYSFPIDEYSRDNNYFSSFPFLRRVVSWRSWLKGLDITYISCHPDPWEREDNAMPAGRNESEDLKTDGFLFLFSRLLSSLLDPAGEVISCMSGSSSCYLQWTIHPAIASLWEFVTHWQHLVKEKRIRCQLTLMSKKLITWIPDLSLHVNTGIQDSCIHYVIKYRIGWHFFLRADPSLGRDLPARHWDPIR